MELNHAIVLSLAAGILLCSAVMGFRLTAALLEAVRISRDTTTQAIRAMQDNYGKLAHKLESWHEEEIRAARSHTERILETYTVPTEHRSMVAQNHTVERREEHTTTAQHSTNERTADMHETIACAPQKHEPPKKVQVVPSKSTKARQELGDGRIPERHR